MTQTPSTGTQLLERILIQLEYQSAELIGINSRLDTMNLSVGSSNGVSDDGKLVEFDATEIVTTFDDSGTRKLFRIKGGQLAPMASELNGQKTDNPGSSRYLNPL